MGLPQHKRRDTKTKQQRMLLLTQYQLRRAIIGGLKDCINMHGDINYQYLDSASKRIVGQLKQYMVPVRSNIYDQQEKQSNC